MERLDPGDRPGLAAVALAGVCTLTLAGLLVVLSACGSAGPGRVSPYDQALRQVHERRGQLGWDGLTVGMTREQVERAVGQRLGSHQGPDALCGRYAVQATVLEQPLELSFGGPTQGARLEAITLLLPAPPGGFRLEEVKPGLEARLGTLELIPSRHAPELGEAQLDKPLYRTRNGGGVFIHPRRGISLGDVCVD